MTEPPPPHPVHALGVVVARLVGYTVRRPTFALSLLAAVVSLAWGLCLTWQGRHTVHSPGPVALAHEHLDCTACHTQPWQPLRRLTAADLRAVRLTMDQACIVCHAGLVHQAEEIPTDVPNCVSCHREHQGPHGLARVGDASCVGCHAELRTLHGPSSRFEGQITALATHPEFGVLRRREPDPGTIRFNHAVHLKPEGVRGADDKPVVLKCAACHQPGPDGRYMQPIRFAAHCAACHTSALVYDAERFRTGPVPHGQAPETLRGLLRERYTDFIHRHPKELGAVVPVERPLPGRSGIQEVTKEEWIWVNRRLEEADRVLFQGAGGCRYCHQVTATGGGWSVAPPAVAKRWLTCSNFSHFSHRLNPAAAAGGENCTACHAGVRSSTATADVLLPSIRNCQSCHNHQNLATSARADCIECHTYHNQIGGRGKAD